MKTSASEFANRLNGREYRSEVTKEENQELKEAGMLVVVGYSDDLLTTYGIDHDEYAACDGGSIKFTENGPVREWNEDMDIGQARDYFKSESLPFFTVNALWSSPDHEHTWHISADATYVPFDIKDDGDLFCRGIVIDFKKWVERRGEEIKVDDLFIASKRFDYVRYDESAQKMQDFVKKDFQHLAWKIQSGLRSSRSSSLALTKLEEAYMWVGKAIRDDQIARGGSDEDVPERGE